MGELNFKSEGDFLCCSDCVSTSYEASYATNLVDYSKYDLTPAASICLKGDTINVGTDCYSVSDNSLCSTYPWGQWESEISGNPLTIDESWITSPTPLYRYIGRSVLNHAPKFHTYKLRHR